jgi:hypothetical protein
MTLQGYTASASVIIALLALFRPEWSKLFRRWTSKLHFTPVPRIELGYGNFGVTIGIAGALRTLNHDQFIESIDLAVVRQSDQSQHQYSWAVFRTSTITQKLEDFQMALEFLLTVSEQNRLTFNSTVPHRGRVRTRALIFCGALFLSTSTRKEFFCVAWRHLIEWHFTTISLPQGKTLPPQYGAN